MIPDNARITSTQPVSSRRQASMHGFVYFIAPEAVLHRAKYNGLVKIGFTKGRPEDRLRALQTGSPEHLVLWAYCDGSENMEKAFHNAFAELRSHGEWFFAVDRLWHFLGYLGSEPHIGNHICREAVSVALFDNLGRGSIVPPDTDPEAWGLSGDIRPLVSFFPELAKM